MIRDENGAVLIEAAMVLPIVLAAFLGGAAIGQRLMFKADVNFVTEGAAAAWPSIEPENGRYH
jgi:hypothetical protein